MDSNKKELSASRRSGIDHRNQIIRSYRGSTSSNFLAWVQKRKLMKKSEEEEIRRKTMGLAEDCTACIFFYLTIDDLQRSSCVCKSWNTIIMDQSFIKSHLHQSESGLLCLSSNEAVANNTVSVESLVLRHNGSIFNTDLDGKFTRQTRLHFLEIKDGVSFAKLKSFNISCSGRVLGSCNGLILLENKVKEGGLVVLNPATRKVTPLPAGTIVRADKESYGFAFKSSTKEHVAIHMILEDSGYHSCEILTIEKRKWAMVKGPPSGILIPLNYKPVFANGALHWLYIDNYDSVLSLDIEEMKFKTTSLPKSRAAHDEIIEVAGYLCFFTHELNKIDIWIFKGDSKENWIKYYTIGSGVLPDMIPVSGSRFGRWVIFRSYSIYHDDEAEVEDGGEDEESEGEDASADERRVEGGEVRSLFIYDFGFGVMRKVRTKHLPLSFNAYMTHVNSLLLCG